MKWRRFRARGAWRGTDSAVSDLVGNMFLLAITVVLLAALGVRYTDILEPDLALPSTPADLSLGTDRQTLRIANAGTAVLAAENVRAIVAVSNETLHDAALGPPGRSWGVASPAVVNLSRPLTPGEMAHVQLVLIPRGATLDRGLVTAPLGATGASSLTGFDITVRFGPTTGSGSSNAYTPNATRITVLPPTSILLLVDVAHPQGLRAVPTVEANVSVLGGSSRARLHDDGTGGDLVAGDGTYSLRVPVLDPALAGGTIRVSAIDIDGRVRTRSLTATISDAAPEYNSALLGNVSFRIMNYKGSGAGDLVSVQLKVRSVSDPVSIDGTNWTLQRAYLHYAPFKPGANPDIQLNHLPAAGESWSCANATTGVKLFRLENHTVPNYDRSRDVLRYFLVMEWQKTTATGQNFQNSVHASVLDENFVMRRFEEVKVYRDNDWPSSFVDCSNT